MLHLFFVARPRKPPEIVLFHELSILN